MRRLKVILIILILVLVSLFAAFWLRGILEKPSTPKIVVVNTLRWNMTKPQESLTVSERFETRYENDSVDVWVSFAIINGTYYVNYYSAVGADMLSFGINGSANINSGYIRSIDINFSRTDNDSFVNPIEDWDLAQAENLNYGDSIRKLPPPMKHISKPEQLVSQPSRTCAFGTNGFFTRKKQIIR